MQDDMQAPMEFRGSSTHRSRERDRCGAGTVAQARNKVCISPLTPAFRASRI